MKKILLLFAFTLFFLTSFSQDYFEKYFQAGRTDLHSHKILPSLDGGYYVLAYTGRNGEYVVQYNYLIKFDSSGNQLWNYGIETGDYGIGYAQSDFSVSPDSFVYIAISEIGCSDDGSVIKLDRFGNTIWDRKFDLGIYVTNSKFYAICSANNNDQIIGGAIAWNCNPSSPYLCRMSPNGTTIWEETWDTLFPNQSISKIELYHDTTYLVHLTSGTVQINDSGQIISSTFPAGDFVTLDSGGFLTATSHQITILSDSLNTLWTSPLYPDRNIYNLAMNPNKEIIITGRIDTCNGETFISKLDTAGNILFTKLYGGDLVDDGDCIFIPDINHIVVAATHQVQQWAVSAHHFYDCITFTTYTFQVALIKLKQNPLTTSQLQSSSGNYHLCNNDSIILTAPTGFTYSWNTGDNSQSITIDTTGDYQVTLTDSIGNQEILPIFHSYKYPFPQLPHFTDSITHNCTGGNFDVCLSMPYSDSTYDRNFIWWKQGGGYQTSQPILFEISGLPAGLYYCTTANVCGIDTSGNIILQSNQPPSITLGNDTTLCITQSITLDAGNGFSNYLWQDGSTTQTIIASSTTADTLNYSVQVTDTNGCAATDALQIIFDICAGINSVTENNFIIQPNPSTGKATIFFSNSEKERITATIFSATGKKLLSIEMKTQSVELNLVNYPRGVYFVEIKGERIFTTKKLLKL